MSRLALTWTVDGVAHAADVDPATLTLLGRAEDATVRVDVRTVSRRQAVLHPDGPRLLLENVSTTSPTRLDDHVVTQRTPVADGSKITVGTVHLRYHDLSAGDQLSGPVCSNCHRENPSTTPDCWFCGTSMVNASTEMRSRRRLRGRFVADEGPDAELFEGETLIVEPSGALGRAPAGAQTGVPGSPAISVADNAVMVQSGVGLTLERAGAEAMSGTAHTGDVIRTPARRYVAIIR